MKALVPLLLVLMAFAGCAPPNVTTEIVVRDIDWIGPTYEIPVKVIPKSVKGGEVYSIKLHEEEQLVRWTDEKRLKPKTLTFSIPSNSETGWILDKAFTKFLLNQITVDECEEEIKKNVKVTISKAEIGEVERIWAYDIPDDGYIIKVDVRPAPFVEPWVTYTVELAWMCEGEYLYLTESVRWSQTQLGEQQLQTVDFGRFAATFWQHFEFTARLLPKTEVH